MNVSLTIRRAEPGDAEDYIHLMQRILRERPPVHTPYTLADFNPDTAELRAHMGLVAFSSNALFLVGRLGRTLVGALTCTGGARSTEQHCAELGIWVARRYRGVGIGSSLLNTALDWARSSPTLQRLELEVATTNTHAIRLYERAGFVREGVRQRRYLRDGERLDMIMMALLFEKAIPNNDHPPATP